jgi:hypothetical protein
LINNDVFTSEWQVYLEFTPTKTVQIEALGAESRLNKNLTPFKTRTTFPVDYIAKWQNFAPEATN